MPAWVSCEEIQHISKESTCLAGALCSSVVGAIHDWRSRRIPNALIGYSLPFGLMLHYTFGGSRGAVSSAIAGIVGGSAFLMLYIAGGMGAGDVKLMAAVSCIVGGSWLFPFLAATVFSGAVYGIVMALFHRKLKATTHRALTLAAYHWQHGVKRLDLSDSADSCLPGMPFALPIAAGCLITLCTQIWKG